MPWTTDTLQQELTKRKKSALTAGEQQEAIGYLQSKGWQGGEISDQHANDIFYTAGQRWPQVSTAPPHPPEPPPVMSTPGPEWWPGMPGPGQPGNPNPPPPVTVQPTQPGPPPPPGWTPPPPPPFEGPNGNPPPQVWPPPVLRPPGRPPGPQPPIQLPRPPSPPSPFPPSPPPTPLVPRPPQPPIYVPPVPQQAPPPPTPSGGGHFQGGVMAWSDADVQYAASNPGSPQTGAGEWGAAQAEARRRGLPFGPLNGLPYIPGGPPTPLPGSARPPTTGGPVGIQNPPPAPGYVDPWSLWTPEQEGLNRPTSSASSSSTAIPNNDTQSLFMSLIAGRPFNQQTLLEIEPILAQYGIQLTPPNSVGERTKIYDPVSRQWVRVGFGEGRPVWIPQGGAAAPSPTPSPTPAPTPTPQPTRPRAVTFRVDDARQGTDVEAVQYLTQIAQQSYGRAMGPEDIQYAANFARQMGWQDGQPVTGRIFNALLAEMDRVWGGASGPSPTPTPGPTPGPTPPPGPQPPPTPPPTVPPGPQGPTQPPGPTVPPPTTPPPIPNPQIPPVTPTPNVPGPVFSDPNTRFLEEFINARLQELLGSRQDPALDQYANLLQGRIDNLQQPVAANWDRDRLLGFGRDMATNLATTPPPANAERDAFLNYGRGLFGELQGDPFSSADLDLIQTQQIDPIERDRSAARQRIIERLAQRGIGPDSGLYQSALAEADRSFDALRSQAHGATSLKAIDQRHANRAQAVNLGQILSGVTDQTNQEKLDRQYQALDLGSNLSSITDTMNEEQQQRARELLGNAQGLAGITSGLRGEQDRMRSEALSLASLLADLPERRLQLAQSVANGTPPPEGLFNSFLNLLGIQQQGQQFQQQFAQNNTSQMQQGLGMLARTLSGIRWGGGASAAQAGPYASGYVGGNF